MSFQKITLLFCALSTSATACPDGTTTLVSCTLKGGKKQLETCLSGDRATYAFGPVGGPPELQLSRHVRDVDMEPWPGVGSTIWEAVSFDNADVTYRVHYGIDRRPQSDQAMYGGVTVERGDRVLADLSCDAGSVESAGYSLPLFEAKENAGQTFVLESRRWE